MPQKIAQRVDYSSFDMDPRTIRRELLVIKYRQPSKKRHLGADY